MHLLSSHSKFVKTELKLIYTKQMLASLWNLGKGQVSKEHNVLALLLIIYDQVYIVMEVVRLGLSSTVLLSGTHR